MMLVLHFTHHTNNRNYKSAVRSIPWLCSGKNPQIWISQFAEQSNLPAQFICFKNQQGKKEINRFIIEVYNRGYSL